MHENPVKGWREGADPRGHCHRLIGCATMRPLASALVGARIAHLHTLSGCSFLRHHISQPSRNKPGPRRFDDRDCDREGRATLSTRSRVVLQCKTSFECLSVIHDARSHFMYIVKHLRVSSAALVVAVAARNRSYETRTDVQYGAAWIVLTICHRLARYNTRIRAHATALVALSDPVLHWRTSYN